jgi:hypothetical protein
MSATNSDAIAGMVAAALLMATLILPCTAQCKFTSALDVDGPTSVEADQLLDGHPRCGALILYSIIVSEHPELLLENLDTAALMADALAVNAENYDNMMKAFRVIALHLSEHCGEAQSKAVEYWRRACDNMERCASEAVPSPTCNSAPSAVDNFAY